MFDMIFYIKIMAGVSFIIAGISFMYDSKKNPNRYKHGVLPAILFLLAGVLQLISALAYILST